MNEPTVFPELNELLAQFITSVQAQLGDNLVGAYLVGSFALRAGDMSSDCDFLVVTADEVTGDQEQSLRELHDEIPTRPGYWAINLEGSYAPKHDLASLQRMDQEWLYINRGLRKMQWSTHCNVVDTRWILREHGIPLVGPEPRTFTCEVPADMLRDRMRVLIEGFLPDLETWASFDNVWTQRYAVETVSRMLYTLHTGRVASKRASLQWARQELEPAWRGLIAQALADRPVTWDDPSDPDKVAAAIAFAEYAKERVRLPTPSTDA